MHGCPIGIVTSAKKVWSVHACGGRPGSAPITAALIGFEIVVARQRDRSLAQAHPHSTSSLGPDSNQAHFKPCLRAAGGIRSPRLIEWSGDRRRSHAGGLSMLRRTLSAMSAAALILSLSAGIAAAGNPSGSGQPGASCGAEGATVMPNGFNSGGFAIAETHYAGSDGTASLMHSNSDTAVSQYDVACYQITLHH
jgi:hypothetical protein